MITHQAYGSPNRLQNCPWGSVWSWAAKCFGKLLWLAYTEFLSLKYLASWSGNGFRIESEIEIVERFGFKKLEVVTHWQVILLTSSRAPVRDLLLQPSGLLSVVFWWLLRTFLTLKSEEDWHCLDSFQRLEEYRSSAFSYIWSSQIAEKRVRQIAYGKLLICCRRYSVN